MSAALAMTVICTAFLIVCAAAKSAHKYGWFDGYAHGFQECYDEYEPPEVFIPPPATEKKRRCIMPEMPYCPACPYGLIYRYEEWEPEDCDWICTYHPKGDQNMSYIENIVTDTPRQNVEVMHNLFYIKDGETWVRGGTATAPDAEDESLNDYIKQLIRAHDADIAYNMGDDDMADALMAAQIIEGPTSIEGLLGTVYNAGWAFSELRAHLQVYEQTGHPVIPLEHGETIQDAIYCYGKAAQVDMAIEEMSELTKALLKERRGRGAGTTREAVTEEIADVYIMLAQLLRIFNCQKAVQAVVADKMDRLRARLDAEADAATEFDVVELSELPAGEEGSKS